MKPPQVSVIIVNYKSTQVLLNCLNSIRKSKPKTSYEIIIIDNDKKSNRAKLTQKFKNINYHKNRSNQGFGAANNLGSRLARGKYLFFLNPDTLIQSKTIDTLAKYLSSHKQTAVAAPLLLGPDHQPYPLQGTQKLTPTRAIFAFSVLNKLFPQNPISRNFWLKDTNRSQPHQVAVVPGSAFMIKKSVFEQIGAFDENYFLYFEESDLCLRVGDSGYKLSIIPQAKVVHTWAHSTKKENQNSINRHFNSSRYYYFKKNFGSLHSLLVNAILGFSKQHLIFSLIIAIAAFARFYRLDQLMPFIGDFGTDFIAARNMLQTGQIPLLGIPSSVPRFHQGPLYVWFLGLALGLGNLDPLFPGLMAASFGLLAVGVLFLALQKHQNFAVAALASLILATSPLAIIHSRMPYHTNAIPLFSALYLYSLFHLSKTNRGAFLAALSFSLLFQLELVAAPLFLLIPAVYYLKKSLPSRQQTVQIISGLALGLLPLIIYDLTHKFAQLGTFAIWIAYRIVSFTGILPEHTTSTFKLSSVLQISLGYAQRFFSWQYSRPTQLILITSFILLFYFRKRLAPPAKIIIFWLSLSLGSYLILGNASEAYFPILFVPAATLVACLINQLPRAAQILSTTGLILLSGFNLTQTIQHDYYLQTPAGSRQNPFSTYGPPISDLYLASRLITNLKAPVRIFTADPGSHHPTHLDNYRYLITYYQGTLDPNGFPVWISHRPTATKPLDLKLIQVGTISLGLPF